MPLISKILTEIVTNTVKTDVQIIIIWQLLKEYCDEKKSYCLPRDIEKEALSTKNVMFFQHCWGKTS